jgi:aryl-alcohol dehydrogenase-like predicted oxidoreductase
MKSSSPDTHPYFSMKTIPLGFTNIPVSSLCLGAMYFGTRNDEETSFRLLDIYVEAGGFFIDTANIYAPSRVQAFTPNSLRTRIFTSIANAARCRF